MVARPLPPRKVQALYFGFVLSFVTISEAFPDFVGKVKNVDDGDTIIVLHDDKDEHIRLNGIDAPEKTQTYGKKAKHFTEQSVQGKEVTILEHGKDKHGRTIGDVVLPDGRNLSEQLIKEGLAWWFFKHSKDETLKTLEIEAREAKKGSMG